MSPALSDDLCLLEMFGVWSVLLCKLVTCHDLALIHCWESFIAEKNRSIISGLTKLKSFELDAHDVFIVISWW